MINKYKGSFIGLAIGDTLGMPLEFKEPGEFDPLTKPESGGLFDLPLGYWTDDTSMALCLADSLLEKCGYDSYDVMEKYWQWRNHGYRSSMGSCFDIGNQTSIAIDIYKTEASSIISADKGRLSAAGNGSIMRLAPIIIASHAASNSLEQTMEIARISGRETHYSYIAEAGTAVFGALIFNAFNTHVKSAIFNMGSYDQNESFKEVLDSVLNAQYLNAGTLNPSGYIIDSLVCAVWAFVNHDSFKDGALAAVNLGGDADTIGAIYGQLAGAFYGYEHIPVAWKKILYQEKEIAELSVSLGSVKSCQVVRTRFEEDGKNVYNAVQNSGLAG